MNETQLANAITYVWTIQQDLKVLIDKQSEQIELLKKIISIQEQVLNLREVQLNYANSYINYLEGKSNELHEG